MEWVETTAKTVAEAQSLALDQLGVLAEEAEMEIIEEPKPGLFGRVRGNARVKARVRPTAPPPKQDRRRRNGKGRDGGPRSGGGKDGGGAPASGEASRESGGKGSGRKERSERDGASAKRSRSEKPSDASADGTDTGTETAGSENKDTGDKKDTGDRNKKDTERREPRKEREMMPATEQREAGEDFLNGLMEAFGFDAEVTSEFDDEGILSFDVRGDDLGLIIGPGLHTLDAVQEVCRNSIQRQADGREYGKVVLDVCGVRSERTAALEDFVRAEAEKVRADGEDVILDAMSRSDRKIVHDVVAEFDDLDTESVGEDPRRRVVLRRR